ncbi:MAG: hypothetical protein Faunusvirus10_9 [Faunusvirus sp.]|jgi:SNF2 family DNA or RNA helicase|uniref:DEAD/SNF2-like helicase n=1 Tax=Faunusvirus sp. TaxID=2487766 RepID=A0A3G4ZWQ9_9VIRU|nr:MAG: hypothetical protein Faunusvirus10_9 [Faunusvirus sp.]
MQKTVIRTFADLHTSDATKLIPSIKIGWLQSNLSADVNGYFLLNDHNEVVGKMSIKNFNIVEIQLLNNILTTKNSIWDYKMTPKKAIPVDNTAYNGNRIYKLDISVDTARFNEKIKNGEVSYIDNEFLHSLYVNKFNDKIRKFTEKWKEAHIKTSSTTTVYNQPNSISLKLFGYQLRTLEWMKDVENKIDANGWEIRPTVPLSSIISGKTFDTKYYDILDKKILENNDSAHKMFSKGGVLADEMGLGKTISIASLMISRPRTDTTMMKVGDKLVPKVEFSANMKIKTKANLVVCPSHLTKQWYAEILKCNPLNNVVLLLTKPNHENVTLEHILNADTVIVSCQFLTNLAHYVSLNYKKLTPSQLVGKYDDRYNHLMLKKTELFAKANNVILETVAPMLEFFQWHRLVVDEAHELFGAIGSNTGDVNNYLKLWLSGVDVNYKWYVSGTPFVSEKGFESVVKYLGMKTYKKIAVDDKIIEIPLEYDEILQEGVAFNQLYEYMMQNLYCRNTKAHVGNEFVIPSVLEETIFLNLTSIERNIYNSHMSYGELYLRQLCCHPNISDKDIEALGTESLSLEEVRQKLIEHKKKTQAENEQKLKALIASGPDIEYAYEHRKKQLEEKIKDLVYIIKFFEKLDPVVPTLPDDSCPICLCDFDDVVVTECGHYYCKECINNTLNVSKKMCPLCRAPLTLKNIYAVKKSDKHPTVDALTFKYGSKLGKMISICKQIFNNPEHRIIIFSQWDRMLHNIGKTLDENNIQNVFCKGNVHQRNAAISAFKKGTRNGKECRAIMLSLEHAASGTTLTEATHIIMIDPIDGTKEEIKAIENQAIGRACRLGQKNQVKVIRLIVKDTIEEEVYKKSL